jgi:hypothetical protein
MVVEWNLKDKKAYVKINTENKMKMNTNLDWVGGQHLDCLQSVLQATLIHLTN